MGRRRSASNTRRAPTRHSRPDADSFTAAFGHPAILLVTALTIMAAVLHLAGQSLRPIWLDEALTYWAAQRGVRPILQGIGTDGTPPLYFLFAAASMRLFGGGELALRLPSLLAALALIPAIYFVARIVAGARAALMAAVLAAVSPLVHYYAVEARTYTLLMLETTVILYALVRAMEAPGRVRWWIVLACLQAAQLWTHIYGVFLLPMPSIAAFSIGEPQSRGRRVGCTVAAALAAVVVCIPWLRLTLESANTGVGDWIQDFWTAIPPAWAIPTSIEAFGFGGPYPGYLSYMALAPHVPVVGLTLSMLLLAFATIRRGQPAASQGAAGYIWVLVLFVSVPLVAAWTWSMLA
jgi:uncharacterized membrane protein